MGQSTSSPAEAQASRPPTPINASDASAEVPIKFSANDFAQSLNAQATELEAKRFYSEHEWNNLNEYQRFVIISTALEFRDRNERLLDASDASNTGRSKPTPTSRELEDSQEPASRPQYTVKDRQEWYQALHEARYDREAKRQWGDQLYAGKLRRMNKNCVQCSDAGVACIRDGDKVVCQHCANGRCRIRCEHVVRFYVDYASKKLQISVSEARTRYRVMGGARRSMLPEIQLTRNTGNEPEEGETRHGQAVNPPSFSAFKALPPLHRNLATVDKSATLPSISRARHEACQSPRQHIPLNRLASPTGSQGSSEYVPSRSSSPFPVSHTTRASNTLPVALEEAPINFSVDDISGDLTFQETEVEARRFYSGREWDGLNDFQRSVIASKAVEFRDRNRHGLEASDLIRMDIPNPYSKISNEGLEEWPAALKGVQVTKQEEEEWRQVMWDAMYDRLAQRQWGDRIYAGKLKMSKNCSSCIRARIPCIRKANTVVCTNCRERRASCRCQHLERFYVDYASRKLNINLSVALARYSLLGGATRESRDTITPEPSSNSRNIRETPAEATTRHALANCQDVNGAKSATVSQQLALSSRRQPAWVDPPSSPSGSDNSIEVIAHRAVPSSSLCQRNGASKSDLRSLATSTGSHWKRKSEQLDKQLEEANRISNYRYSTVRALAENLFHQVSNARSFLESSIPSLPDASPSSSRIPIPARALSEQEERLRAALSAYRKGLQDLEGAK